MQNRSGAITKLKASFSAEKAHKTQIGLSKKIILEDEVPDRIRFVSGVDVAYAKDVSIAAITVLDFDSLMLKESQIAFCKTRFPYIPTLLSFREIPPAVQAIRNLRLQPDVFLVDAHGYAHPYRCGFASHLGLVIKKPTVGVAKSMLIGTLEKPGKNEDVVMIRHKGEIVGAQVTTKHEQKPVYVSVGHMVSLKTAIKIVKKCTLNSRIPEPIAMAHKIATAEKRKINIPATTDN
jgi:deoxyribonuclease V